MGIFRRMTGEKWVVVAVAAVVGGACVAVGLVERDLVVVLGMLISALGVGVALAIFLRQGAASVASESRIVDAFTGGFSEVMLKKASEDVASADQDYYEEETRILMEQGTDVINGVRFLVRERVPLSLVHDLVNGWELNKSSGSWELGDLRVAFRRVGKGNHAWWVVFRDPNTQMNRIFRLARGGRSKGEVSVTEETNDERSPQKFSG